MNDPRSPYLATQDNEGFWWVENEGSGNMLKLNSLRGFMGREDAALTAAIMNAVYADLYDYMRENVVKWKTS